MTPPLFHPLSENASPFAYITKRHSTIAAYQFPYNDIISGLFCEIVLDFCVAFPEFNAWLFPLIILIMSFFDF